jgi:hypothetical protein
MPPLLLLLVFAFSAGPHDDRFGILCLGIALPASNAVSQQAGSTLKNELVGAWALVRELRLHPDMMDTGLQAFVDVLNGVNS